RVANQLRYTEMAVISVSPLISVLVECDDVGEHPDLQLPGVPTERPHAIGRGRAKQVRGLMKHPAPKGTALVELQRTRLLEDVDHRVGIAAQVHEAARRRQSA